MSLRRDIRKVGLSPVAALAAAFLVVLALEAWRVGSEVNRAVGGLARGQLERTVSDFRLTCEMAQAELDRRLAASLAVAEDALARAGGFGLADVPVSWRAVNQLDGAAREVTLKRALLGAAPLERNTDFARPTPLVDDVTRLTGAAATVFQRMDEAGDMLRVATSVKNKAGARAVGTFIPAAGPDGPSAVVATVLRGERYQGRAFVVDAWYVTVYAPLRGPDGRVEGMLFVGVRQDALEGLKAAAERLRIGESGRLLVLGAKGSQRGRLLMGGGGLWAEGEDLSALPDGDGRRFFAELVDRAPKLAAGAVAHDRWIRPAAQSRGAAARLAAYAYFAPWDWVIAAGLDEDEADAAARSVRASLWRMTAAMLLLGAAALAGAAVYARRAAVRIAAPVEAMAAAAGGLARGDLDQAVVHRGDDEVGRLAEALRQTVAYVREVSDGAHALAGGDLGVTLAPRSEADRLTQRFAEAQRALRELVSETGRLTRAALDGELAVRADPSKVRGAYAEVLTGLNHTLDALCAPVEDAAAVLARLGAHDLTARVATTYRGDHARLKEALDATSGALAAALSQASAVSREVAAASQRIAASSQQVAAGAQSQASVLEETGAALESVSELTRRTAASAEQATALAAEARRAAEQGHGAVEAMNGAVAGIRGSAESTSQIIKDVSEIALQTNLLALNAAVEAARAGEAGRGFAVVAEEVRSLALRAREAAAKTESLIQQSVAQAGAGEAQARQVAERLSEIEAAVAKVSAIVGEIAGAAREQSSGIEGVHRAIAGVGDITQQNAAGSDESSTAAQALSQQAAELAALIGQFRLDEAEPGPPGPPQLIRAPPRAPTPGASDRRSPRC